MQFTKCAPIQNPIAGIDPCVTELAGHMLIT